MIPVHWLEIRIHTSQEAVEAISYFLHEQGLEGVVIDDPEVLSREWDTPYGEIIDLSDVEVPSSGVVIKAYAPLEQDSQSLLQQIESHMNLLPSFGLDPGEKTIATRQVLKDEWMNRWKQFYQPIQVTNNLVVKPIWDESLSTNEGNVIQLDPGLAFGTGNHETTLLCLRLLETYVNPDDTVIDVGSGSGILSVASVFFGARDVCAIDLDPEAVKETEKHIEMNQVTTYVRTQCSDGLQSVSQRADVVVANLLTEILLPIVQEGPRVLKPGGRMILSGILTEKENTIVDALHLAGLKKLESRRLGDWVAIVAEKW